MRCRCGAAWVSSVPTGCRCPATELAALDPDAVAARARPGPSAPPRSPTSCTTCCSRWWRPGRVRTGRTGTTRSSPTAGRACSTAAGWRPSAATAAASLGDDDDAAAACVAGHLQLAGPVTVEQLVADAALPVGRADGRAALDGPGPHGPGPARGQRAPPSSCPTVAGAPATSWCACTAPAAAGAAAWSTRCRSPTSCASSRTGST